MGSACGLLLACSVLVAACSRVLGDVELVQQDRPLLPPDPGAPSTGGVGGLGGIVVGPTEPCEAGGQLRCAGQWLEACVSFGTSLPTWVHLQDCQANELCLTTPNPHCAGLGQTCTPGETQCNGATPRVCNALGDGWSELPACMSAAHCSTSPTSCSGNIPCCLTAPCQAGEMRCNQGQMQRCNEQATDWQTVATCETADLCLAGLKDCGGSGAGCICRPAPCQQTESRCTGTALERCNDGRTDWEPVNVCATAALCELGRAKVPAVCETPKCEVGSHICTEAGVLQGCRVDRTGYDDQEACEGPQFCDPDAGRCNPVACEAGDRRCNGAQIEVCLPDRTGFRPEGLPCATSDLCDSADPTNVHCDPPACAVGEFNCFGGAQLQACNAGRTRFEPFGPACLRPDLCSAPRQRCDFCFPGRQECTPELDAIRVCSITGNFFGPETFCPLGCNGPLGQCVTCQPGGYRCNGSLIERCANDGRSFAPLNRSTDCANGTQFSCSNFGQLSQTGCGAPGCNATRGLCNECAGTSRVCSGDGFRQCTGGVFGATQACGGGLTCRGAGTCGCTPGAPSCDDDTLEFCNALGTGFVEDGERCDDDLLLTCNNGRLVSVQCSSSDDCESADGNSCD